MDYQAMYQQKLTTAEEAVKVVRSGDWVDYTWCTNHPIALDKALAARKDELTDVKVRGGVTMWMPEIAKAEDAGEAETAEESDEKVAIAQSAKESAAGEATAPITGPAPISHAEGKVPANKRPKNEELKTPWSDGRTFPGTSKNAQCPCGSGRKYKMCHGQNEE